MGRPRPTCEECGQIELSGDNAVVWQLFHEYQMLLGSMTGFGGWSINADGVRMIASECEINDVLEFVRRIQTIALVLF